MLLPFFIFFVFFLQGIDCSSIFFVDLFRVFLDDSESLTNLASSDLSNSDLNSQEHNPENSEGSNEGENNAEQADQEENNSEGSAKEENYDASDEWSNHSSDSGNFDFSEDNPERPDHLNQEQENPNQEQENPNQEQENSNQEQENPIPWHPEGDVAPPLDSSDYYAASTHSQCGCCGDNNDCRCDHHPFVEGVPMLNENGVLRHRDIGGGRSCCNHPELAAVTICPTCGCAFCSGECAYGLD